MESGANLSLPPGRPGLPFFGQTFAFRRGPGAFFEAGYGHRPAELAQLPVDGLPVVFKKRRE